MSRLRLGAFAAGLALASVAALSGCSGLVDNAVDSAVDKAAEKVAENAAEDFLENALESDTGEKAEVDLGIGGSGASIPADFPSEVPLPDGLDLGMSMKISGGYNLSYHGTDRAKVDAYIAKFSGWEEKAATDLGELRSWMFTNGTWSVTTGDITDSSSGEVTLTITVTPVTQ